MGITAVLIWIVSGGDLAPAQIFFPTKPKQTLNPEQVAQICQILKSSGEESTRLGAVDELRMVEGTAQPIAVAALMETLKNDRKTGVRAEAAVALSKMRPVRQEVGVALENTIAKDTSMRVRIQARSALLQYNLAGYRSAQGSMQISDPLGHIAKEPNTTGVPAKSNWNWVTNPFGYGDQTASETNQSGTTDQQKPWPRPGKIVAGWFQAMIGSPDSVQKDKNNNPPTGVAISPVPMPTRLPAQVSFPIVPEFSPQGNQGTGPTRGTEPSGPELGIPKP